MSAILVQGEVPVRICKEMGGLYDGELNREMSGTQRGGYKMRYGRLDQRQVAKIRDGWLRLEMGG